MLEKSPTTERNSEHEEKNIGNNDAITVDHSDDKENNDTQGNFAVLTADKYSKNISAQNVALEVNYNLEEEVEKALKVLCSEDLGLA